MLVYRERLAILNIALDRYVRDALGQDENSFCELELVQTEDGIMVDLDARAFDIGVGAAHRLTYAIEVAANTADVINEADIIFGDENGATSAKQTLDDGTAICKKCLQCNDYSGIVTWLEGGKYADGGERKRIEPASECFF